MEKSVQINEGGIDWRLDGAYPGLITDLVETIKHPEMHRVKSTRVRSVFFIPKTSERPGFVLKEFKIRGIGARIRSVILGSPAMREYLALDLLKKAEVSAPIAVAVGVEQGVFPSRSWIVTETIEDSFSLEEILLKKQHALKTISNPAYKVGRLVGAMHQAGVIHNDLHAANILLDRSGEPYVLDLHGARIIKNPSLKKSTGDLVSLAGAFMVRGVRTDRLRFFKAYCNLTLTDKQFKTAARNLEEKALLRLREFLIKFDTRPLRPGRGFQAINVQDLNGIAERSSRARKLALFLDPYSKKTLNDKGVLIHSSDRSEVYEVQMDSELFIVKRYTHPGLSKEMKRVFKGSGARRSWINYHKLLFRGISVPKPVLYLEEPLPGPAGRSFVVTEGDRGFVTLDKFVERAGRKKIKIVISRLCAQIARMHRLFLRNRDMKAQNILVGPSLEICFIDPDGVKSISEASPYFITKDLMRLNASFAADSPVSRTDRLRFLLTYMIHMKISRLKLRELWREIYFLTWAKWDKWYEETKSAKT